MGFLFHYFWTGIILLGGYSLERRPASRLKPLVSRLGCIQTTQYKSLATTIVTLASSTRAHKSSTIVALQFQTTSFLLPDSVFSKPLILLFISTFLLTSIFLISTSFILLASISQLISSIALLASLALLAFQFQVFVVASVFYLARAASVFHYLLFLLFALLFLVLFAYPGVVSQVRPAYLHNLFLCLVASKLVFLLSSMLPILYQRPNHYKFLYISA